MACESSGVWSCSANTKADGDQTKLVLDRGGVLEDVQPHIDAGWHRMHWEPLRAYL